MIARIFRFATELRRTEPPRLPQADKKAIEALEARTMLTASANVVVNVQATAGPWNPSANASYPYADGDETAPTVVDSSSLPLTSGGSVAITYLSGEVSVHSPDWSSYDADGDSVDAGPQGTAVSPDGTLGPSAYIASSSVYLGELVGTFATSAGAIVGTPFAIGDAATEQVPAGAVQLQLGINDWKYSDNAGSFSISVTIEGGDLTGKFTGDIPDEVKAGEVVDPRLIVTDSGSGDFDEQETTDFYLSTTPDDSGIIGGPVKESTYDLDLRPDESHPEPAGLLVPEGLEAGNYYIIATESDSGDTSDGIVAHASTDQLTADASTSIGDLLAHSSAFLYGDPVSLESIPDQEITSTPAMPAIPVTIDLAPNCTLTSTINYDYTITYTGPDGRRIEYRSSSTAESAQFTVQFADGVIRGGAFDIKIKVDVLDAATGQTRAYVLDGETDITGDSPDVDSVKAGLGNILALEAIAYQESARTFDQFDANGEPLFGKPHGYGVMQIDTPRATDEQVWDWQANVAAGVSLYNTKVKEITSLYTRLGKKYGVYLSSDQLQTAVIQYYNGGLYWVWSGNSKTWVKGSKLPSRDANGDPYADIINGIIAQVQAGSPPAGWNG
jgi:hypothetical protein